MSVSVPVTTISVEVLELATRNRMLFCEMTIGESEEMRTTSAVSVEKDLIGENKVE